VTLTDVPNADYAGVFTRASDGNGNYVKFTVTGTEFTVTATPTVASTATRRAPVNGIEIVPVATPATPPVTISVNFIGDSGTVMGPEESAGVVEATHWNNAAGGSASAAMALVSETGGATNAKLTWAAAGTWKTSVADAPGNQRMMSGYLDTTSTSSSTVTVGGLSRAAYDVYVYVDGDNHGYARTSSYTISGSGITSRAMTLTDAANATFAGTFAAANNSKGNYLKFTVTGSGFTLTATPVSSGNSTLRAPINAIQIVPH
jgi:hypothetical protein